MNKYIDVHHHILPSFYRDALNEAGIPKKFVITLPEWTFDSSKAIEQYPYFSKDELELIRCRNMENLFPKFRK